VDSTRAGRSARCGTTPLLTETLDEVGDLTESLEVQQGQGVTVWSLGGGGLPASVRPAQSYRRLRAILQTDNEVWINTPADADDLPSLATQRVMGMRDRHRFQRELGKRGSVLRGSRP
jgi:hypothetical protein